MKILIYSIIASLLFSCSLNKGIKNSNKGIFKSLTVASYSYKRSGEVDRNVALINHVEKKELFNKNGILYEFLRLEIDGSILEKTSLQKDSNNKLIKSTTYDKAGNEIRYIITAKDETRNAVFFKTYNNLHFLTFTQEEICDSRGNVISNTRIDNKSKRTYRTTSKYNLKDQLIEETDFSPDGTIRDTRTFEYDKSGNEIESDLTKANGDYTKFVSEFDENGNIINQNWFDKNGKQKHNNSFTYVYDLNQNWITRKRYSNGKLGYVWERKIEYY